MSCCPPPATLWVNTDTPSDMVNKQTRVRFQHSITEFVSSMGRWCKKETDATNSRIREWTMKKFKSSRKQATSKHFPMVQNTRLTRPMPVLSHPQGTSTRNIHLNGQLNSDTHGTGDRKRLRPLTWKRESSYNSKLLSHIVACNVLSHTTV